MTRQDAASPIDSRAIHLLYLGRRHPLKGLEYLEAAVAELNSNPVNPVNPVQKTSTRPTRLKTSASLRLCVKIISNAYGEELEKVWDWCDVLVLPTLSENFGLVVAEALERGKCVITTDGAPAWGENLSRVERVDGGMWSGYGGRLIYLKGYRDGTPEDRVRLLKSAIENLLSRASLTPPAAK
jgi:glycosyltransferase involved in cell wall biosynthesis